MSGVMSRGNENNNCNGNSNEQKERRNKRKGNWHVPMNSAFSCAISRFEGSSAIEFELYLKAVNWNCQNSLFCAICVELREEVECLTSCRIKTLWILKEI